MTVGQILFPALRVLHGAQHGLVEVVGHVSVITVNHQTPGPCGRVATSLQLEVTVIVGASSDAGVGELHRVS